MASDQRIERLEQGFVDLVELRKAETQIISNVLEIQQRILDRQREDGQIFGKMAEALSALAVSVDRLEKGQESLRSEFNERIDSLHSEVRDTNTLMLNKLEELQIDMVLVKTTLMPEDE